MVTSQAVDVVVQVMGPHIGETMARSATEAHCRKLGIEPGSAMSPEQVEALLGKLLGGLNIFLGREKAAAVVADVRQALASGE